MDFDGIEKVEIREGSDNWGPFIFGLSGSIPPGDTIASVEVKAYAGTYKPAQAVEDQAEIPLIDDGFEPDIVDDTDISIRLKYPGDGYKGKTTIVFDVTLAGTGKYQFFCHRVKVV